MAKEKMIDRAISRLAQSAIKGFQDVVNSNPVTKAIDRAMEPIVESIPGHGDPSRLTGKLEEKFNKVLNNKKESK